MDILLEQAQTEIVVKNSRFIARVTPVTSQKEARETLAKIKGEFFDARHVVHAFVTGLGGEVNGMSDDGEPSGTAGRPVLDVLKGSGITNILLTVTRYFGGTLLGTGGLVHAYGDSAKAVLEICNHEPYVEKTSFSFECLYGEYDMIKRLLTESEVETVSESWNENVGIECRMKAEGFEALREKVRNATKGRVVIELKCAG